MSSQLPPPEPSPSIASAFPTEPIQLIDGPLLAVRRAPGPLRPIVLIPDVGRDSRAWGDVAPRLAAAGHEVVAVDLRGHGGSEATAGGYDTDTCADDLATLIELLGYAGGRSPILAGHGWGANVAMSMAARRDGIAGLACFNGGWIRPAWQFASTDEYLAAAGALDEAPATSSVAEDHGPEDREPTSPAPTGPARTSPARTSPAPADRVRAIRASIYRGEPRAWYPLVRVPVLLAPAVPADGERDRTGAASVTRTGVAEATAGLIRHRVSWYTGASHDLPQTRAARVTDDLLQLATAAEPQ